MNEAEPQFRVIGEGASRRRIAFRRLRPARPDAAGVVWLGGFMSDMASTKSVALRSALRRKRARVPALRLFRPRPYRRRFRAMHADALARRSVRNDAQRKRGAASDRRLVDGRLPRFAAGARNVSPRRGGAAERLRAHRAGDRFHRDAACGRTYRGGQARHRERRLLAPPVGLFAGAVSSTRGS